MRIAGVQLGAYNDYARPQNENTKELFKIVDDLLGNVFGDSQQAVEQIEVSPARFGLIPTANTAVDYLFTATNPLPSGVLVYMTAYVPTVADLGYDPAEYKLQGQLIVGIRSALEPSEGEFTLFDVAAQSDIAPNVGTYNTAATSTPEFFGSTAAFDIEGGKLYIPNIRRTDGGIALGVTIRKYTLLINVVKI